MHHNGRINYKGQETNADGSHAASQRSHQASLAVLKAAEGDADNDSSGDDDALEDALEEMLEAEMEGHSEEDSFEEEDDDNEDNGVQGNDDLIQCIYNTPADVDITASKRKADSSSSSSSLRISMKKNKQTPSIPDNFSEIYSTISITQDEIKSKFPKFLQIRDKVMTFELKEGDMLYIPAGWYHEVLSYGGDGLHARKDNITGGVDDTCSKTHMALNFWFHPPDDLNNFDEPYTSSFWKDVTESAMRKTADNFL